MDSQFNGPKTYHSHIKYHMTLNIIFSVPNHHQHEHLPVECGVPEGAGSNVSKHHSRLRGESSRKTIIFLYPTLKNVQQRLSTLLGTTLVKNTWPFESPSSCSHIFHRTLHCRCCNPKSPEDNTPIRCNGKRV